MGTGAGIRTRAVNLHEAVRDVVNAVRRDFPDALVDLEHRGDGEAELDVGALASAVEAIARAALSATRGSAESVWMRSSGADPSTLSVTARWRGPAADPAAFAAAKTGLEPSGGSLDCGEEDGDGFAKLVMPRFPASE